MKKSAFSLIELLIVIVILGGLGFAITALPALATLIMAVWMEKKGRFNYIPRDFSEVKQFIDSVNEKYGIEVSIVEDIEVYIILNEMRKIAEEHGYEDAMREIDDLIKQNFAKDLTKQRFIMLSRKMHESILKGKNSIVDVLENVEI